VSVIDDTLGLLSVAPSAGPVSDLKDPHRWVESFFGARPASSGARIGPENAHALGAYFAAIRNISEDVGKLPLHVIRRVDDRNKRRASDHPLFRLLRTAPNKRMTAMSFRRTLTSWALGWGRGIAHIRFGADAVPSSLEPIHPSRVTVRQIDDDVFFDVRNDGDGGVTRLEDNEVLHIHGQGDGVTGFSIARIAAEELGIASAAQRQVGAFFSNGTMLSGALVTPQKMNTAEKMAYAKAWTKAYSGTRNAHGTAILDRGIEWKPVSIGAADAQLLESRRFSVEEIARWFRIPPHKIGDLSNGMLANVENMALEYVTDTLMAWLETWEEELQRKLFADDLDHFAEHEVKALLRGDMAARQAFYTTMVDRGIMTRDEIRASENLNAIEGPDEEASKRLTVQKQMVTLNEAARGMDDGAADSDESAGFRQVLWPVFRDAASRCVARETKSLRQSARRDDFFSWSAAWYRGHAEYVRRAFAAPLASLLASVGGSIDHDASSLVGPPRRVETRLRELEAGAVDDLARRAMALVSRGRKDD